jgi:hypothetical protein
MKCSFSTSRSATPGANVPTPARSTRTQLPERYNTLPARASRNRLLTDERLVVGRARVGAAARLWLQVRELVSQRVVDAAVDATVKPACRGVAAGVGGLGQRLPRWRRVMIHGPRTTWRSAHRLPRPARAALPPRAPRARRASEPRSPTAGAESWLRAAWSTSPPPTPGDCRRRHVSNGISPRGDNLCQRVLYPLQPPQFRLGRLHAIFMTIDECACASKRCAPPPTSARAVTSATCADAAAAALLAAVSFSLSDACGRERGMVINDARWS